MLGIGMVIEDVHLCLADFEFGDVANRPDRTGCGNRYGTLTNTGMFAFCSHGVTTPGTGHCIRSADPPPMKWSDLRYVFWQQGGGRDDEERLTADIVELARQYGRYGYRKIAALLRRAGWLVNDKRVERIWRREGLKVPSEQPKRGRLWLTDGSCIRLRAERGNHVWSYDFLEDRTHDGRKYR